MAFSDITCICTPPSSPIAFSPSLDSYDVDFDITNSSPDASSTFHEETLDMEKTSIETQKQNGDFWTGWHHNTGTVSYEC